MSAKYHFRDLNPVARPRRLGFVQLNAIEDSVVWVETERRKQLRICLRTGVVLATSRVYDDGTPGVMSKRRDYFGDLPPWPTDNWLGISIIVALLESELTDKEFIQSLRIDGIDVSETTIVRNFRGFYSTIVNGERVCPSKLVSMALTTEVNAKETAST